MMDLFNRKAKKEREDLERINESVESHRAVIEYLAGQFFREWIEDRGDAVSHESIKNIASRAITAAEIFTEEMDERFPVKP